MVCYILLMRRRLGQVFLVDRNIIDKIVNFASVTGGEWIVEIGSGRGDLTEALLEKEAKVIALEVDRNLVKELRKRFVLLEGDRLFIYNVDFLKANLAKIRQELGIDEKLKCVSNIPYYITTPILTKLIDERDNFSDIYLTVQKEVADRLVAESSTSEYGSLTVFISYFFEIERLFNISRNCFRPVPRVSSTFIRLKPRQAPPVRVDDLDTFFKIVRLSFGNRRKKLRNAIKILVGRESVGKVEEISGISLDRRGETLTIEEFAILANAIFNIISQRKTS